MWPGSPEEHGCKMGENASKPCRAEMLTRVVNRKKDDR